ncbi:portal vertex of the head [Alishewanella phage vB_AspM_Slicko01]|nr:portal vertex of the head [Alishewanella phage vB_AspM_Slicko01]
MAEFLKESTWKPVMLGSQKNRGGYDITATAVSSSWYNQQIDNTGSRLTRLKRYHSADCCSVEISRALDILSQDISSSNADDEPVFLLKYDDSADLKKSTISLLEEMRKTWQTRTEMGTKLFDRVRKVLKYGSQFWQKNADGSLKHLPTERMIGYILDDNDEEKVTHYIYDPKAQLIEGAHLFVKNQTYQNKEPVIIPVEHLLILKIGDKPFGESIIERVYSTWKQLHMLETAMVIYRVVRAPERRIYYIDTGNLQGHKREAAIEKQRLRLMQKQATKNGNGDISTEYDPHSTSEDIFIPTNSQGKGSRIETLAGGQSLGEVRDVQYFLNKLAAGLRIPSSMIDSGSEDSNGGGGSQYSDMRVGQVYQVEIRYMGHVKRIQRYLEDVLHDAFFDFCKDREIIVPDEVKLEINEPNSFSVYKDIEVNQALLNVYNSALSITQLSKKLAMKKYLNLDEEDLRNNEYSKMIERGLDEAMIKKLPQNLVENIVYGDGKVAAVFLGIDPEAFSGGAF